MMMDTLARDTGEILSGPNLPRRVIDLIAFTNDGLVDNGRGPSAVMDGKVLKTRLSEELFLQAQTRLPTTYERLAKRIVVSGAIGAIRNALERLMDDDADEGRPLLADVAVGTLDPGIPAPLVLPESREPRIIHRRSSQRGSLRLSMRRNFTAPSDSTLDRRTTSETRETSCSRFRRLQAGKENEMLIAKDIMTSPVVAVGPDSTVSEVADVLVSHGISAVPVIDRGALLGIVSEGDLIRRAEIGTAPQHRSWWLRLFADNAALRGIMSDLIPHT